MMKKILKLALTDFKIIFRDNSLKTFLVLPFILFAMIIWLVPALVEKYDFLQPYLSLFLVIAVIENTQVFSFISSMVLIDEKETDVAKVYGVVPMGKFEYLVSRFLIPYFFTVVLNLILFEVQSLFEIAFWPGLAISMVAAMVVPVYVLTINSNVKNRMEGMVWIKAMNMLVLLPIAAFFVPEDFKNLFGILPTHWLFQSIDLMSHNLNMSFYLLPGAAFLIFLLWWFSKSFLRKHFV